MSGKLRVHELAKQLGVTSKELLAQLKEQGEFVKTASSTVEPPVVRRMKQLYAEDGGQKGADSAKPGAGAGAAAANVGKQGPTAVPEPDKPSEPRLILRPREIQDRVRAGASVAELVE